MYVGNNDKVTCKETTVDIYSMVKTTAHANISGNSQYLLYMYFPNKENLLKALSKAKSTTYS